MAENLRPLARKGKTHIFIPIHLVWYHQELREYIPVAEDHRHFQDLPVHHVLCLIDDIYDVYKRLRGSFKLFDRQSQRLTADQARQGYALPRHLQILEWRSREIAASETLANNLGAAFTVVATKHEPAVVRHLLRGKKVSAYLSHPITEIRRDPDSTTATSTRDYLWELQTLLAKRTALFQPTTIDEYRLATDDDGRIRLSPRFFLHDRYSRTMFDASHINQDDPDDVFYDDIGDDGGPATVRPEDRYVSRTFLLALEPFIEKQVTARDHQLVAQSDVLIVFRPRLNGHISGGVRREVSYHQQLVRGVGHKVYKHALILDTQEDHDAFPARQLLEQIAALVESSHIRFEGAEVRLGLCGRYHRQLSLGTKQKVAVINWESSLQALEHVLTSIMGDLGWTSWTISRNPLESNATERPLDPSAWLKRSRQKEDILTQLRNALRPFERTHPYDKQKILRIDGLTPEQVCDRCMEFITGLRPRRGGGGQRASQDQLQGGE